MDAYPYNRITYVPTDATTYRADVAPDTNQWAAHAGVAFHRDDPAFAHPAGAVRPVPVFYGPAVVMRAPWTAWMADAYPGDTRDN